MKFFVPMLLLIGVVILMGGAGVEGLRGARSVLLAIGVLLLTAVIFALIVRPVL